MCPSSEIRACYSILSLAPQPTKWPPVAWCGRKESVFDSFHAIDTQIKLEGKKPQLSGFKHTLKQEAHFYNSQFIGFMKHLAVNSSD
jgi:hypothetical protein